MKLLNYKEVAILGAGSHTRSSINLLKQNFVNTTLKIYDDNYNISKEEYINGLKLVGTSQNINQDQKVFLSIGSNEKRSLNFDRFKEQILKDNLFHTKSYIEKNVILGIANQIYANTYINADVEIGNNNIINTGAILEHEVKINNHNHISVASKICGRVKIGSYCFIGAGAVIIDKISICDNVIIGAGAVVINDITESGTYVGTPARKIK